MSLAPRDPKVPQEGRGSQEHRDQKATLAMWAPQDPRAVRGTPAPWVAQARLASWEPQGLLDLKDPPDPQGPLGLQDQDLRLDLKTWKAPGFPSGQQPETPRGGRDCPEPQDSRGTLEQMGDQGPREKSVQMAPLASQASPGEMALWDPRDPREKRESRERKETPGRMG